jgi:hypothetical protein
MIRGKRDRTILFIGRYYKTIDRLLSVAASFFCLRKDPGSNGFKIPLKCKKPDRFCVYVGHLPKIFKGDMFVVGLMDNIRNLPGKPDQRRQSSEGYRQYVPRLC